MQFDEIDQFEAYMNQMRYSSSTMNTYLEMVKHFRQFINPLPLSEATHEDLERFNTEIIMARKLSHSYQNQMINALKLFYRDTNNHNPRFDIDAIERPIKQRRLPVILSKEEVERIISRTYNMKHRTMLMFIYSCGLRRSELLHMHVKDIDSNRMIIHIRNSKGNKDRIVPLTARLLRELRVYYKAYRPQKYLFEGASGAQYSATSLQKVFKTGCERAKILKKVTLHTLRHSYATHMLESGVSLRHIQILLGHNSSRTTEIYTHVQSNDLRKLINPMDSMEFD